MRKLIVLIAILAAGCTVKREVYVVIPAENLVERVKKTSGNRFDAAFQRADSCFNLTKKRYGNNSKRRLCVEEPAVRRSVRK
jgi:hypothetical protein